MVSTSVPLPVTGCFHLKSDGHQENGGSSINVHNLAEGLTEAITKALRQEIASAIHEEREARISATKDLICEIEAERVDRCAKDADLHARMATEIARIDRQMEIQTTARESEMGEIRATLDATWRQLVRRPTPNNDVAKVRYFQDGAGNCKEFLGDPDDMSTLYDLAKEAVDQAARVEQQIAAERRSRLKQIEKLKNHSERLHEYCKDLRGKLEHMASHVFPKSWTLAQLVEKDPQWNLFLTDPDGLFNKEDVVDAAYRKYLGDVLPLMVEHNCPFKVAVGLLADSANAYDTEVSTNASIGSKTMISTETDSMEGSPKKIVNIWESEVPSLEGSSPKKVVNVWESEMSTFTDFDMQNTDAQEPEDEPLK